MVEVDLMSERLVEPLSAEQKDVNHDGRSQQNGPLPTHSRQRVGNLPRSFDRIVFVYQVQARVTDLVHVHR